MRFEVEERSNRDIGNAEIKKLDLARGRSEAKSSDFSDNMSTVTA